MAKNKVVSKTRRANGEGSIYQRSLMANGLVALQLVMTKKAIKRRKVCMEKVKQK